MQLGFFFDQTRCYGCGACVLACKQRQSKDDSAMAYNAIVERQKGKYPNLQIRWLFLSCFHCADPPCVRICPTKAIQKRTEDGIVTVDQSRCPGKEECGALCLKACAYDAPKFMGKPGAKMEKCDGCLDKLKMGQDPYCVAACPLQALGFAPITLWESMPGAVKAVEGFNYLASAGPAVAFRPNP